MIRLDKYRSFEWDEGNIDKSYLKHGITPNETEESFLDQKAIINRDVNHSQTEERFILLGKTFAKKLLIVVFTIRERKLRIISARKASRKERREYEEKA